MSIVTIPELCNNGRAGINALWATSCKKVAQLKFNNDREITEIIMDLSQSDPTFKKIAFERDTAFFSQVRTRIRNHTTVRQSITITEPTLRTSVSNALLSISNCCCIHLIIRDANMNYHYVGIDYDEKINYWESTKLKLNNGGAETGADPTTDSNEYTEVFSTTSRWYAPFYIGGENGIITEVPVDCCSAENNNLLSGSGDCLLSGSGDCLIY